MIFRWIWRRADVIDIAYRQHVLIQDLKESRKRDQLQYSRNLRDLLISFRGALEEDPETVIPTLDAAILDMRDEVARAEEHSGL